jgi:4-amino-4-deoxy-L-arabinose transferase-like glycosyltransferase
VLLVAVWAAVFLPRLGVSGLSMTEGHRAIPAWTMLRDHSWFVPHLFERPYLRKPPGIQWAIAASSSLLGTTELAARLPSALGMLIGAAALFLFARRWFGPSDALSAGLAYLLMPLLWPVGRSAEIESLHTAAILIAALAWLDPVLRSATPNRRSFARQLIAGSFIAGLSLAAALLLKGPAGLPVIAAAALITCTIPGGWRAARTLWLGSLIVTSIIAVPIALKIRADLGLLSEPAVTQGVSEFLWSLDRIPSILLLVPAALLSAMPASLALLFPWGPDARREAESADFAHARHVARTLSLTIIAAIAIYAAVGISNPRYAMPAAALSAAVVPYLFQGLAGHFMPIRTRLASIFSVSGFSPSAKTRPWLLPLLLTIVGVAWAQWNEGRRDIASGRSAGQRLAQHLTELLPPGREIWADHLIEARPEVLWYAQESAQDSGSPPTRFWWRPPGPNTPKNGGLLLRDDPESDEATRARTEGWLNGMHEAAQGDVYKYRYRLYLRD